MILVEGIRCDVFQCLSYRWKRRKDIERMAKKNTYDAGSIAILEGLEAVRKRPGMYIGSVSTKGLNHLIYEIVDNAVDEHLAGYCSEIHVTLEKDGSATIADNGRGVVVLSIMRKERNSISIPPLMSTPAGGMWKLLKNTAPIHPHSSSSI